MAQATETPSDVVRSRKFRFRANAQCTPQSPGFNGVCNVINGDEFFMTIQPYKKTVVGRNGVATTEWAMPDMPTWCDVLDEYPVDVAPQPLRKLVPATPAASPVNAPAGAIPMAGSKKY